MVPNFPPNGSVNPTHCSTSRTHIFLSLSLCLSSFPGKFPFFSDVYSYHYFPKFSLSFVSYSFPSLILLVLWVTLSIVTTERFPSASFTLAFTFTFLLSYTSFLLSFSNLFCIVSSLFTLSFRLFFHLSFCLSLPLIYLPIFLTFLSLSSASSHFSFSYPFFHILPFLCHLLLSFPIFPTISPFLPISSLSFNSSLFLSLLPSLPFSPSPSTRLFSSPFLPLLQLLFFPPSTPFPPLSSSSSNISVFLPFPLFLPLLKFFSFHPRSSFFLPFPLFPRAPLFSSIFLPFPPFPHARLFPPRFSISSLSSLF